MADESIPLWWVLLFLVITIGSTLLAVQFIGAEFLVTAPLTG
jgi:hypothetical protein